jgi:hypothetical protein
MTRPAFRLASLIGAVVVAVAACGGGDAGVETVDASKTVEAAIGEAAQADAYRVTSYTGQRQLVPALGLDIDAPIDPAQPTIVVEVDAAGENHTVIELASILPPGTPDAERLGAEIWQNASSIVADTTAYQLILDANPAADLGVFRPGIWSADLTSIDADGGDLVAALGGSGLDPRELGASFLSAIEGIAVDPVDPTAFSASTTYGAFVRATGQDVDLLARTASDGVSRALGTDTDVLASVYAEVYENAPTELSIEIVDGRLRALDARVDLAAVWSGLAEAVDDLGLDVGATDRAALAEAAVEPVYELELRSEFEFDDSIDVAVPDGPAEDRTAELVAYLTTISGD